LPRVKKNLTRRKKSPYCISTTRWQRAVSPRAVSASRSGSCYIRGRLEIRTWLYIDGFNLYYGAVKGTPYKWLDVLALGRQLLPPTHTIDKIKYFTARVSGAADPNAPRRQHAYLSAIDTLPQLELHYGSFLAKTIWRPLTNFPVAGATIHAPVPATLPTGAHNVSGGSLRGTNALAVDMYPPPGAPRAVTNPLPDALVAQVHTMEEKGSDVNLAVHLLNDAWSNRFDAAGVISNDTDLVTPIQMVVAQGKPVFVICPGRRQMARQLAAVASYKRHIRQAMLAAAQLPNPIPGTGIQKPTGW